MTSEEAFPVRQEKSEVAAAELPTQRDPDIGVLQPVFEFFEQPGPPEDAAVDETPAEPAAPPRLAPREQAVLAFESRRFQNAGRKEQAIRDEFDISPTQYFQILNALLDDPAALAHAPTLVARLRRLREARQQARR